MHAKFPNFQRSTSYRPAGHSLGQPESHCIITFEDLFINQNEIVGSERESLK